MLNILTFLNVDKIRVKQKRLYPVKRQGERHDEKFGR
jgi:hypothetical protein